ncbi:MAG: phage major capsid protein [Dehalococcoidia bacterium]
MPPVAEELQLPTDLDTATRMLNDPAEVNRWLRAGQFANLQARFNELERPPLANQIADILDAREAANGTVAQATRAAMDDWFKEHGLAGSRIARPGMPVDGPQTPPRNRFAGQIEAIGFTNLGDFARSIWHKNETDDRRQEMQRVMNAAFSSGEAAAGGFLIPESLFEEIHALQAAASIFRQYATVIDMTSPKMLFPYLDSNTNSATSFGGWTVTRVEEGGTITPSRPNFGRVKLEVTKQVAGAEVPNEMFSDVASLDGYIRTTLPQAMAFAEDYDFFNGGGAGAPLGVLNEANGALITVAAESGQPASTVVLQNILNMYSRMLPRSKGRAVWFVNPTVMKELWQLSIAVGTGGAPVMLMDARGDGPTTLLGRPVVETEMLPALGSAGQILYADLSHYLIGDRPGGQLESSPHAQFMNDLTEMKLTARNDGRPWVQGVVTPVNGDTLSPFVQLGAVA